MPYSTFFSRPSLCPLAWQFVIMLVLAITTQVAGAEGDETQVLYNRDVRPILSNNCFKCHGPDGEARQGELRLDHAAAAKPVLSPGQPTESKLIKRILSEDADFQMPPPDSKLALTAAEKETLQRWVQQGANYQRHWSFEPILKAEIPTTRKAGWPSNAVDHFVLSRLEREGLEPSPSAARAKLLRRLTFDLTGLPPTLKELDDFLADDSGKAYENAVDRLLKNPAHGERMATNWLDVARYSDTYGYQVDRDRYVWPWKDWVIKAFNDNLPYDDFITWQLAGDLLPQATDQQVLATTFNRLHPQKVEGGSVPEEFRVEYVADRTQTTAMAFLGLTLECARCHDHKYDPVTQKEYYQLFSFFNNIDEAGLYAYFTSSVPTPTLLLSNDATKGKIRDVEASIQAAEKQLTTVAQGRDEAFHAWLQKRPEKANIPGQVAHLHFEDFKSGANQSVPGKVAKGVKLSGDDGIGLKVGNFPRFQPFSVALWMNTPDLKERSVIFHRSRAWTDSASRGYQLLMEEGHLSASLIHFWPGNAIRVRTRKPIAAKTWVHVAITYDGSSRADGLKIYLDGQLAAQEMVRDNLYKNITGSGGDNITIGQRFRDRGFTNGLVDEFRVYNRELTPLELQQVHNGSALQEALVRPLDELDDALRGQLRRYYLATADTDYQKQLAQLQQVRQQRSKTVDGITEIMVMRERHRARSTHRLQRGAYDNPQERVDSGTPAALPSFPRDQPRNRLGLARWLVAPNHPLTARTTVNRYWQMLFGQGLVSTPEDFGSQGKPASHPELLDWLARDLIEHEWDLRYLLKTMVMSATYRQQSTVTAALQERDPDNRLLARGPRFQLPAEMLRDNALAVSGLLVNKVGGPPVRPYEVAVSFKPVGRDKGEGLYRRSLYTFWKRTGPAPVMMTLDAAKRDVCVVKRERTASPLQAVVMMNDPQFVEAARMLAQKLVQQHQDDTAAIIVDMFRLLTSRRPTAAETTVLSKLVEEQIAYFQQDPKRAETFLKTGDTARDPKIPAVRLAAIGMLANALMNFDECVIRR
jgi:mono/diheme cytochrome c family protein